jgi:predicted ester cyclase
MSADENIAVVERLVNAFNERDFRLADALFAVGYVSHNPPPFGKGTGEAVGGIESWHALLEAVPDARAELIRLIPKDDRVIAHTFVHGRHEQQLGMIAPSHDEIVLEFIKIYRIENGRIAEDWGLVDALELMRQLGASPTPVRA